MVATPKMPAAGTAALLATTLAALLGGLSGCGALADAGDPGPALWAVRCEVTQAEAGLEPTSLRAALLWSKTPGSGPWTVTDPRTARVSGIAHVAQDVPVETHFPARFDLSLYELPPEDAFVPGEQLDAEWEGWRVAFAALVLYDDQDGDGRLDMLPPDAEDWVDRVVGPTQAYGFWIFQADSAPPPEQDGITPGLTVKVPNDALGGLQPGDPEYEDWLRDPILPIGLAEDPTQQILMCSEPVEVQHLYREADCEYGEPPADMRCSPDGRTYSAMRFETNQAGPCTAIINETILDNCSWPEGDPPPDWPCDLP